MANARELKALPSKVILQDGDTVILDNLSEKDKAEVCSKMCENISRRLGLYYSSRPQEWTVFVNVMS